MVPLKDLRQSSLAIFSNISDIIAVKTIILTNRAAKELDSLPIATRSAIEAGLDAYAVSGRGDVKRLQGREGFRLRIGRYRVIFAEDAVTILAFTIGKRETNTYRGPT